jgi:hypothetical protein
MWRSFRLVILTGLVLGCGAADTTRRDLVALFPFADVGADPTTIDLGAPDGRPRLGRGWSGDETTPEGGTFVWGTGAESTLDFYLRRRRAVVLALRGAPLDFPGAPPQTVTVAINGVVAAVVTVSPGVHDYRVQVAARATRPGWNQCALRYAYSRAPRDVIGSVDGRPLAVAWDLVRVEPDGASPVGAPRVDEDGRVLVIPSGTVVSYYVHVVPGSTLEIDALTASPDPQGALRVRIATEGAPDAVIARLGEAARSRSVAIPERATGIARLSLEADARPGADVRVVRPVLHVPTTERAPARAGRARPNVIVYLVDTLRADAVGCYGQLRPTSPTLDGLAADSVVFTEATADSPWTRSSVASLFTGLSPLRHGVNGRVDALSEDAVTIAELLRDAGYETAGFVTNGNVAPVYGFAQGFDVFELLPGAIVPGPDGVVPEPLPGSDVLTDRALAWLERRAADKPFFLYLHAADPHSPYLPAPRFLEQVGADAAPTDVGSLGMMRLLHLHRLPVDEALVHALRTRYDAEVAQNDYELGRLVRELRRRRLLDDSIVVFTADHGEEFHEHGGWEHGRTV